MTKINWKIGLWVVVFISSFMLFPGQISNGKDGKDLPQTNNGKPWRIAYCQSGEFVNYASTLYALANGLSELGWIDIQGLPYTPGQKEARLMWEWLATHSGGYVEFVPDAYYSLEKNSTGENGETPQQIVAKLTARRDIDLILVMGTQAGELLAKRQPQVPTLVFSTSNAVQSGIIQSVNDSGVDNLWAHVEPTRYQRQIEIFHDLFAFKKLGMVYDDSPAGKVYAAVADVEKVAMERGFEITSVIVPDKQNNRAAHRQQMLAAYEQLVQDGVDAVYCSLYLDRDVIELSQLFAPLYEKKIPVFSQMGVAEVKNGALLSVSRADFVGLGKFGAYTMTQVFHGIPLRQLPQIFENTPSIVLNLEVAEKVHYNPPFEVLLVADEIYPKIENKK